MSPTGPQDMESRLRAAFAARAEGVTPESLRPADVPVAAPPRPTIVDWLTRRRGVTVSLGVLAGAAAIAVGLSVLSDGAGLTSTAPQPAAPVSSPTGGETPTSSASPTPSEHPPTPAPTAATAPPPANSTVPAVAVRDLTVLGAKLSVPATWTGKKLPSRAGSALEQACVGPAGACAVVLTRTATPAATPLLPGRLGGLLARPNGADACGGRFASIVASRFIERRGGPVTYAELACGNERITSWTFTSSGFAVSTGATVATDAGVPAQQAVDAASRIVDDLRPPAVAPVKGSREDVLGARLILPRGSYQRDGSPNLAEANEGKVSAQSVFLPSVEGGRLLIYRVPADGTDLQELVEVEKQDDCLSQVRKLRSTPIALDGQLGTYTEWGCSGDERVQVTWTFPSAHLVFFGERAADLKPLNSGIIKLVQSARF